MITRRLFFTYKSITGGKIRCQREFGIRIPAGEVIPEIRFILGFFDAPTARVQMTRGWSRR
jgi:hypothetical protein